MSNQSLNQSWSPVKWNMKKKRFFQQFSFHEVRERALLLSPLYVYLIKKYAKTLLLKEPVRLLAKYQRYPALYLSSTHHSSLRNLKSLLCGSTLNLLTMSRWTNFYCCLLYVNRTLAMISSVSSNDVYFRCTNLSFPRQIFELHLSGVDWERKARRHTVIPGESIIFPFTFAVIENKLTAHNSLLCSRSYTFSGHLNVKMHPRFKKASCTKKICSWHCTQSVLTSALTWLTRSYAIDQF